MALSATAGQGGVSGGICGFAGSSGGWRSVRLSANVDGGVTTGWRLLGHGDKTAANPVSSKRMTEAYRGLFTITEHRLDRSLFHVIRGLFPRLVPNSRVSPRREKDLHDFSGSLGFAGCARCSSLCYRTVKWCRTVSAACTVDVGTVLDKGFDGRGASEAYCMV
jgi:hypothetical protein